MPPKNHYETLEIKQDASATEIKHKYYKFARELHPDRTNGCPIKAERFKKIGAAYAVLSDPETRRRYDVHLELERLMAESDKNQERSPRSENTSNTKFKFTKKKNPFQQSRNHSNSTKRESDSESKDTSWSYTNTYSYSNVYTESSDATSSKDNNPTPSNDFFPNFGSYGKIFAPLLVSCSFGGVGNIVSNGSIFTTILFSTCQLSLFMIAHSTENLMQIPSLSNNKTYLKHEPAIIFSTLLGASSLIPALNFFSYKKNHPSTRPGLLEGIGLLGYVSLTCGCIDVATTAMLISGRARKPKP